MIQKTIGFISPYFDGFYYGNLLRKVHAISKEHGCRLILFHNSKWCKYNPPLAVDHIDGWITTSHSVSNEFVEKLLEYKKPIVNISEDFPGCHSIQADNQSGMFEATEHLIQHGHRNIAFIIPVGNHDFLQRLEGYKKALQKHGIPYNPDLVIEIDNYCPTGGSEGAKTLLDKGIPFTAIESCVDYMVPTLLDYLKESGYRVPEDIAVVGFDNMLECELFNPPLSTVQQSFDDIASTAFKLLTRHMDCPGQAPEKAYIITKFVQRKSCGCEYFNKNEIAKVNTIIRRENDLLHKNNFIAKSVCYSLSRSSAARGLSWLEHTQIKHACMAVYAEDNPGLLTTEYYYPEKKENLNEKLISTIEQFPTKEIISGFTGEDEVLVISTVQTEMSNIGAICLAGSIWDVISTDRVFPFLRWVGAAFEKQRLTKRLNYLANHDPLCGLPNRKLLLETLANSLEAARQQNRRSAIILIDLDNFKKVNDLFGHAAGDKLLIRVSELLKDIAGDTAMAARLGGDEFVIFISQVKSRDEVIHMAERIVDTINIPFSQEESTFHVTASVGISLYPEDGDTPSALLKKADIAMYKAKDRGKGNFCYCD